MITKKSMISKMQSYHPKADMTMVSLAYDYAKKAHEKQKRASGETYFSHPVAVADILCDMQLDVHTVIAALLHDTVEDCLEVSFEEIENLFGLTVKILVDGVTKIKVIESKSTRSKQAENFSKLLLAISKDIRVLLIKLADRLHNMRTLHYIPSVNKRKLKAQETIDIYIPLAASFGISKIQDELEDLAFITLNPEVHKKISKKLKLVKNHKNIIENIIKSLEILLDSKNLNYKITGRIKRPYSIWNKMYSKNIDIEQLLDIVAFRIIVEDVPDCYTVMGILHTNYKAIHLSVKDYISTPKSNGYQSLHTVLIGPEGQKIEIQIRTKNMHKVAEFGVAAHWPHYKYDHCKVQKDLFSNLLEIHNKSVNKEEFFESTKLEMFGNRVFCFSPNGGIKELPEGSTPVDFAYSIHSEMGNKCESAKINGKIVPLMTRLGNGDQVEIITCENHQPSPAWEHFVVTGKAKVNIRKFIRTRKPDESITLGKAIFKQLLQKYHIKTSLETVIQKICKIENKSADELYILIANGALKINNLISLVCNEYNLSKSPQLSDKKNNNTIVLNNLTSGLMVHYGECCHPLPGDHIMGVIATGHGIIIHKDDCNIIKNFIDEPDKLVSVAFSEEDYKSLHTARLSIIADNNPGALGEIANTIAKNKGNIINVKIKAKGTTVFELHLDIEVNNTKHLANIVAYLRTSELINKVKRI